MSGATLLALATFCFATSITPGPNNMMVLASGANFGFQRTLPHLLGITIGFGVMLLAVGLGVGGLFATYPVLYDMLRVVGASYLLWLAWRIATTRGLGQGAATARPMTFLEAAAFQWVNPKGWAASLGAITAFVAPDAFVAGVLIVAAMFGAVMFPCIACWAGFGIVLSRFLDKPWTLRAFNVTMAVLLVASLYPMFEDLRPQA